MSGLEAQASEGGDLPEGGGEGGDHQATDFEALARQDGWKPKEQFRGNAEEWVDAETFVKRGQEINPILRKNNERLQRELDGLRSELREAGASIRSLQEYNAKIAQTAFDRALKRLKAEKRQALADGDNVTAADLDEQIDELRENPPPEATPPKKTEQQAPQADPLLQAWMTENAGWFNDQNPEMVDYANAVGMRLRRQDPGATRYKGQAFLDEIKRSVEKAFPDKFSRRAGGPALVEGGSGPAGGSGGGKGKTIASLPGEARASFKQLSSEKWYTDLAKSQNLTPEQMFLRDYGDE